MRRGKKRLLIGIGCVGLAIVLLLLAFALTLKLVANRELVKSYIAAKTAQATGGHLDYEQIDISYLPLPHLVAQGIRLTQPQTFSAEVRKLSLYPRILAMLGGRLSIRRLVFDSPDIQGRLPWATENADPTPKADKPAPDPIPAAIGRQIKALFGTLAAIDPHTQVEIDQGRVTIDLPGAPAIRIDDIKGRAERMSADVAIDLSCSSNLVEDVKIQARVALARFGAEGSIDLTDIHPNRLFSYLALPRGTTLAETTVDADLAFTVDGADSATGRFRLQTPALELTRGSRRMRLSAVTLAGQMAYGEDQVALRLDTITTRQPALDFSANAVLGQDESTGSSHLQLSAAANQLDVAVAGDVALAVAGDQGPIRTAFDVARAGVLVNPLCSVTVTLDRNGWHLNTMRAGGRLTKGKVRISQINADIEDIDGEIVYEDDHVNFSGLSGRFEGAAFNDLDVSMNWARQTTWSLNSPAVDVEAFPFFTWLTDFDALTRIRQTVSIAGGRVAVSKLNISGPLTAPEKWVLDVIASPRDLVLSTPQTPFGITLSGGEIAYRPGNDRSSNVGIAFLDASLVASHQRPDTGNPRAVEIQLDGSLGSDALDWLATTTSVPDYLRINPAVSLTGITIKWDRADTLSFSGELKTADGATLFADLTHSPEELAIREIRFSDGSSKATLSANRKGALIGMSFLGNLKKQTVDRLLKTNPFLAGNIEGRFSAQIDTGTPLNSTFNGELAASGIQIPKLGTIPISIDRFSVIGRGKRVDIRPSEITVDDTRLRIDGSVEPRQQALMFDLNADTDRLDLAVLQSFKSANDANASGDNHRPPPEIVSRGTIHFTTRSLTYGDFTWSPVSADIRIAPDGTVVTINQARLCGISTAGDLDITPRGIGFNIHPLAAHASLQQTYDCLWDKHIRADAEYDLEGDLRLMPTHEDPLATLSGRLTFSSQDGRVYQSNTLLKIFSVLNITELFTGGKSDLRENGYGYAKAWATARIENGALQLDEILLDGYALKITGQGSVDLKNSTADIIVLAAPLKTVDRVVNQLPIIKYITGGSLITVPLRLHGKLKDLSVTPLPPSAVGKGLLRFMERTLKAPFKLVEDTMTAPSEQADPNENRP